jgi:hypothetical protein
LFYNFSTAEIFVFIYYGIAIIRQVAITCQRLPISPVYCNIAGVALADKIFPVSFCFSLQARVLSDTYPVHANRLQPILEV